jgi:flavin-dependent dehydrogenase
VEQVENLVIGGGPAGLRAAEVLAEAGREVLVLEKNREVGPKTCAGGLTRKAVRELLPLGLPADLGLDSIGHVAFTGGMAHALNPTASMVRTIPRRELGQLQLGWARRAGAEVRAGVAATRLNLAAQTVVAADGTIRYRRLIGADGSDSGVRRALGLPHPRAYFAAEFNVPGLHLAPLRVECDPDILLNGYFWVFPHTGYTSIGAVAPKRLVAPGFIRRYLTARAQSLGADLNAVAFEGATLEVNAAAFDFPGGVHLVGDAAGMPSSLTAEGIYAALVTGEETARRALDPAFPSPKTRSWLRVKRAHDRLAQALRYRPVRDVVLAGLARMASWPPASHGIASWFLDG